MFKNKIFSLDVESNGLWGNPISIGFTVEEKGKVIKKAEACFISEEEIYSEWVAENVIKPLKENREVKKCNSYLELLTWFAKEYMKYKNEYTVLYHMGHIVEANLFKELKENNLIGEWDAPYTPIEISTLLSVNGFAPDSVDQLVEKGLIEKPEGNVHQALYDAEVAAKAYWYLLKKLES